MEGFTPTFFLEVIIAVGSGVGSFYAMKADLRNMFNGLAEETRLREEFGKSTDKSIHDVRDDINKVSLRVARQEGANDLAERVVSALKR